MPSSSKLRTAISSTPVTQASWLNKQIVSWKRCTEPQPAQWLFRVSWKLLVARALGKPVDAMSSCTGTQRFGLNHFRGIHSNGLYREVRLTVSNVDDTYITRNAIHCDGNSYISLQESTSPDPLNPWARVLWRFYRIQYDPEFDDKNRRDGSRWALTSRLI